MPTLAQKIVQAWSIDYALVLTAFQEYYAREHHALPLILELIQELKVSPSVPFSFFLFFSS
jgi:hypothetical protein